MILRLIPPPEVQRAADLADLYAMARDIASASGWAFDAWAEGGPDVSQHLINEAHAALQAALVAVQRLPGAKETDA